MVHQSHFPTCDLAAVGLSFLGFPQFATVVADFIPFYTFHERIVGERKEVSFLILLLVYSVVSCRLP